MYQSFQLQTFQVKFNNITRCLSIIHFQKRQFKIKTETPPGEFTLNLKHLSKVNFQSESLQCISRFNYILFKYKLTTSHSVYQLYTSKNRQFKIRTEIDRQCAIEKRSFARLTTR